MKNALSQLLILGFFMASATPLAAQAKTFSYSMGKQQAEGFLALPKDLKSNVPTVILVPDWMGPSPLYEKKAQEVADLGYIALVADVYGKGVRPNGSKEAAEISGKLKNDRTELRKRILSAFHEAEGLPHVNKQKIVVIGYCFGGTTALELGRSGASIAGLVSFHGGLANPTPGDAKNIKGRALILHGAIDPFVPVEEVTAFQKEMNEAGVSYEFISYSGAVHAFTNPQAGNDIKAGVAYNAGADQRSWDEFKKFMKDVDGKN